MGKTYKDHPTKKQYYRNQQDDSPKKKRVDDPEPRFWQQTPSEWNKIMHNRPERKAVNAQLKTVPTDVEEIDIPDTGYKPHIYYW
jgi:hypothetical protein